MTSMATRSFSSCNILKGVVVSGGLTSNRTGDLYTMKSWTEGLMEPERRLQHPRLFNL